MQTTVEVDTELTNGTTNTFDLIIKDHAVSEIIQMEYVSFADGGPLMRPVNPPR